MTASISISRASAPATPTIVPYSPWNQPALRSGLEVLSISSPTLPVTQTAALVTQAVTPRITKSPASWATFVTAEETASQTLPTTGSSHGFGIDGSACAGAVSGPASTTVHRSSATATLTLRTGQVRSACAIDELAEAWDRGEQRAGRIGLGGGERGRGAGAAGERVDFPAAFFPDEAHSLCAPGLLRLDGSSAADDADVPDCNRRLC